MTITIKYYNDETIYQFNTFEKINNYNNGVSISCSYNQLIKNHKYF